MATRNDYEIAPLASSRELYRFYSPQGTDFEYRFTNRDEDYVDPSDNTGGPYKAAPISRGKVKQASADTVSTVDITIPANSEFAKKFLSVPPNSSVFVELSVAYDETLGSITDRPNLIFWKGRVADVKFTRNQAVLTCKSAFDVLSRLALRRRVTIHCPFALFSEDQCRVDRASAKRTGVITNILNDSAITVEEDQAGGIFGSVNMSNLYDYQNHYNGGMLVYVDPLDNVVHKIGILSMAYGGVTTGTKSNVTFNLERKFTKFIAGATVELYPGCSRNVLHCHYKFNNYGNFGGIPHLSTEDPFTSAFRTPLN